MHVYLETFGCQMNDRDSECMLSLLEREGYRRTKDPARADLVLMNTCTIREKAVQKVYARLGHFKRLKRQRGETLILGVAGCLAQQEGERLQREAEHLDLVLGPGQISLLPALLEEVRAKKARLCATAMEEKAFLQPLPRGNVSALVTIMEGCDNFCTYCVVPYVRGRERSRALGEILEEIKDLVKSGTKEVTLIGQNVNSYGKKNGPGTDFLGLLRCLEELPGLERVRFTTSHPRDLPGELIRGFGSLQKLCEHIHLPVQSGSNRILEQMNRGYTREEYLAKVSLLRRACPSVAITTDIIVGFPKETEKDFQETMTLLKEVEFDSIFSFKYSARPLTKAGQMDDEVPALVKGERLMKLQSLQREITLRKNQALEGRVIEILVAGHSKKNVDELFGRSRCNRAVNFPGPPELLGMLAQVKVTEGLPNCLRGELWEAGIERRVSCLWR